MNSRNICMYLDLTLEIFYFFSCHAEFKAVSYYSFSLLFNLEISCGWETAGNHRPGLQTQQRYQHRPDGPPPSPHHQDRHPQLRRVCTEQGGHRGERSHSDCPRHFSPQSLTGCGSGPGPGQNNNSLS